MQNSRSRALISVAIFIGFLALFPIKLNAATKVRSCGPQPGKSITNYLSDLVPGDTLLLDGICNEHVTIDERLYNVTIDGQGLTTISAPTNSQPAVRILGQRVTLRGFTIVAGRHGVAVNRGGTANIDGNLIRNAQNHGIVVSNGSQASITNNTIESNGNQGIQIAENASADIGFQSDSATAAGPNDVRNNNGSGIGVSDASNAEIEANRIRSNGLNGITVSGGAHARIGFQSGVPGSFASANTIEGNGSNGIIVTRSSSAQIAENHIRNNSGNGVLVARASHADVGSNNIDGNVGDGILVTQNSGVNLGADSGTAPEELPNNTTVNNGGVGIRCRLNSTADGRLGSVNGSSGAKDFGRTFNVTIAMNGSDGNWGPHDEVDDANSATANATLLTISGIVGGAGSVQINSQGCHDSLL